MQLTDVEPSHKRFDVELEYFIQKLYMKYFYNSMSASFLDYKLPCEYQEWQKRPDGHLIGILFSASQPPCSSARLDGSVKYSVEKFAVYCNQKFFAFPRNAYAYKILSIWT